MLKKFLALLIFGASVTVGHAQTLDFTLSASSSDGKTVIPKLTWATTPAAVSCTASGDAAWAPAGNVSKPPSGTVALAGVSTSRSYILQCGWPGVTKAVVVWVPPTLNTDGSAYTDPNGFRIQYGNGGPTEVQLSTSVYLNQAQSAGNTWTSPALAPGTWYFGIKAVNSLGLESTLSNVASKLLNAGATQSRTLGLSITVPSAPVLNLE